MPISLPVCKIAASVRAKRERRKDARPGELLTAALELFVEKGFAATRAEEVAKRAGVSKGTLFLYFSSKEELFKAVVRENISGRFNAWNAEFDSFQGNTSDLLRYSVNVWWQQIGSTKASGITKLMMSEAGNFPELAAFYHHEVIQPGRDSYNGFCNGAWKAGSSDLSTPNTVFTRSWHPCCFWRCGNTRWEVAALTACRLTPKNTLPCRSTPFCPACIATVITRWKPSPSKIDYNPSTYPMEYIK